VKRQTTRRRDACWSRQGRAVQVTPRNVPNSQSSCERLACLAIGRTADWRSWVHEVAVALSYSTKRRLCARRCSFDWIAFLYTRRLWRQKAFSFSTKRRLVAAVVERRWVAGCRQAGRSEMDAFALSLLCASSMLLRCYSYSLQVATETTILSRRFQVRHVREREVVI